MGYLIVLGSISLSAVKNRFLCLRQESKLKIIVVTGFLIGFWLGGFFLFLEGLGFIQSIPMAGPILLDRLLYLFFISLFTMLVVSNTITSFSSLYRHKELDFLFALPISYSSIFFYKFIESLILSSWAFFFLGGPFMLAYGLIRKVNLIFYPLIIASLLPFLLIAACLGTIIAIILVRFFPTRRSQVLLMILSFTIIAKFIFFKPPLIEREVSIIGGTFLVNQLLPYFKISRFPLWPNYWIAELTLALMKGRWDISWFYFLLSLSNSLILLRICQFLSSRLYYFNWSAKQEGKTAKFYLAKDRIAKLIEKALGFLRPNIRSLIIKDLKVFWRDPKQWSQFALYFGLLAIYIANIRNTPYATANAFWKNLVSFLNLGATSLTLGALNTRFVFPLLSLEGRRFWILGLAPIKLEKVLWEKFSLSLIGSLIITESLIIASNAMLKVSGLMSILSCWTVFLMSFGLSGLSVGLGATFPNFKEDNPTAIVSGFGGTLTLVLSLLYVGLVITVEANPVYLFVVKGAISWVVFKKQMFMGAAINLCLSLVACILPIKLGLRRLSRREL